MHDKTASLLGVYKMKTTLTLIAVLLLAPLHAKQPDLPMQSLLDHAKYTEVIQKAQAEPDYLTNPRIIESQATAMYMAGKYDDADALLSDALKKFPQDGNLHQVAAMNKFSLAQQASIFSAGGLAKEGRDLLKKAVALSPDQPSMMLDLIGFYVQAPSIAGGDVTEAKKLLIELQAKDAVLAAIGQSMVLLADDKNQEALTLLDEQLKQQPNNGRLLGQKASIQAADEHYSDAVTSYQQAAQHAESDSAKYSYLYQIGRLTAKNQLEPTVGQQALTQFIDYYQGSEHQQLAWAKLRLAQIYLQQKDKANAQQWLASAKSSASDDDKFADEAKKVEKLLNKLKS